MGRASVWGYQLTPVAGEPELDDPAMAGEWAGFLAMLPPQQPPWCFYFCRLHGEPIGALGFKGAPDENGEAEIAYLVFVPKRGVTHAIYSVMELMALAREHGVRTVRAHTLREQNASTSVLFANTFVGPEEVVEPDDGPVWRWRKDLGL